MAGQKLFQLFLYSLSVIPVLALPLIESSIAPLSEERRDLGLISTVGALDAALDLLSPGSATFASQYASILQAIQPLPTPSSTKAAVSAIQSVSQAQTSNVFASAANMILAGLTGPSFPPLSLGDSSDCSAEPQSNSKEPLSTIFPQAGPNDAPYDIEEDSLRSAIFMPANFTYGKVPTVLFVPGTGLTACETFMPNLGKLMMGSSYADPVFLNIPGPNLADAQDNAEYIAYAINYISSISSSSSSSSSQANSNISIITFSAGSIETAWALKYWPSTRQHVSNVINISPDYHGTETLALYCPLDFPCPPLFRQNAYDSVFLSTLRANDTGSSAWVPTTTVYTEFDEIIVPQSGPNASAILGDVRNVGVFNGCTQSMCTQPQLAADPDSGHEDTLFNPLAYTLAKDALLHGGPADPQRAATSSYCADFLAPGLSLVDMLDTQALLPLALLRIETYTGNVAHEPAIKPYATAGASSSTS